MITLGIIGVVAALTLPNLMADTKKKEYSVRLKRFYSIMTRAIMLSEVQNGPMKQWKIPLRCINPTSSPACSDPNSTANASELFYNTYLAPYLDSYKTEKKNGHLYVYLDDGSSFFITTGSCSSIYYDVNGERSPNQMGRDTFIFMICTAEATEWANTNEAVLITAGNPGDRAKGREYNLNLCKTNSYWGCSTLLIIDNWEFKDDYPYKL